MNRRLKIDLEHGEILDVGLEHYGEFMVAPSYAAELMAGGMTSVDGRTGRLRVIERYANAVHLRWVFEQPVSAYPQLRQAV